MAATATVTGDLLRPLAGFHARSGCAISIYLGLDPSEAPTIPDAEAKFRALLSEAEKIAEGTAGTRDCRLALRDDLARIRAWWSEELDRDGAHGVAVFASSADGFFLGLPLAAHVRDSVTVGGDLRVAPLADLCDADGALVAVVSREQGRIYRIREGRLEEVVDESEQQHGRHDQGGWSQANYQRHIEHLVHQHLRTVGKTLDRRARRSDQPRLVVVMPQEMRGPFAARLSGEARDAIAGWAAAEAHATPTELLRAVRPVLDEAAARDRQETLRHLEAELGREGRAVAGWQATLDAAADARVETLLLVEDADRVVWQCPECRRASGEEGTCPVDGLALVERADGGEVAIHQVLEAGGSVLRVAPGALDGEQVAALLRF